MLFKSYQNEQSEKPNLGIQTFIMVNACSHPSMFNFYDISNVLKYSIIYSLVQFWLYQPYEVYSITTLYKLQMREREKREGGGEGERKKNWWAVYKYNSVSLCLFVLFIIIITREIFYQGPSPTLPYNFQPLLLNASALLLKQHPLSSFLWLTHLPLHYITLPHYRTGHLTWQYFQSIISMFKT